jgi:hypothetical protein
MRTGRNEVRIDTPGDMIALAIRTHAVGCVQIADFEEDVAVLSWVRRPLFTVARLRRAASLRNKKRQIGVIACAGGKGL